MRRAFERSHAHRSRLAQDDERTECGESHPDEGDLVARGLTRRAGDAGGHLKAGRDARGTRALRVDGEVVAELARRCVDRDLREPSGLRDPAHALVRTKVVRSEVVAVALWSRRIPFANG